MTQPKQTKNRISKKAASFTESVIREMTREALKYGAVNLGQGFPDFNTPEDIKQAAMQAIARDMAARSDHLLIACTELSLLTDAVEAPYTDSLDCLVTAIIGFARG